MAKTIAELVKPHFFYQFLFWTVLLQLLVWQIENTTVIENAIEHGIAKISGFIYNFYSSQWFVEGNKMIHSDSSRFILVNRACTALSLMATLIAAFFSLTLSWKKKVILAIFAVLLIQIVNIFRITHLFYVVRQVDNHFVFFHLYFWQFINFISALLIFNRLALSKT